MGEKGPTMTYLELSCSAGLGRVSLGCCLQVREPLVLHAALVEATSSPHELPGEARKSRSLVRSFGDLGGRGSKLNRRGYAGVGPCFHVPGFHFGTGFLSHSQMRLVVSLFTKPRGNGIAVLPGIVRRNVRNVQFGHSGQLWAYREHGGRELWGVQNQPAI